MGEQSEGKECRRCNVNNAVDYYPDQVGCRPSKCAENYAVDGDICSPCNGKKSDGEECIDCGNAVARSEKRHAEQECSPPS